MFKLINRYKKAVSPVIAVVLLIALTVAAAAVIWQIVQNNITETGTLTRKSDTTTAGTSLGGNTDDMLTVDIVMKSSHAGSITIITITDAQGETVSAVDQTWDLVKGDNSLNLNFTDSGPGAADSFKSGSTYTMKISWKISGEAETNVDAIKVTAT